MGQLYPVGVDSLWLAADREGHVAAFITAGVGPIPVHWLDSGLPSIEDTELELNNLQRVSKANLLVQLKRPDDFVDLAERGIFAYDWSDIHRTKGNERHAYELIAVPEKPIVVDALPEKFIALLMSARLQQVDFGSSQTLDARSYFSCRDPV